MIHGAAGFVRTRALFTIAIVVAFGIATGCSSSGGSSKPAYCTSADQVKTSVKNLENVDVSKNGLSSLESALKTVQSDVTTFAADAKTAFSPQLTALKTSLAALKTTVTTVQGQSVATAARTVAASLLAVKTSAADLQSAVTGKCT